ARQKTVFELRCLPIRQTGALAAAGSGLRLLTQAAIEKPPFRRAYLLPNSRRPFSSQDGRLFARRRLKAEISSRIKTDKQTFGLSRGTFDRDAHLASVPSRLRHPHVATSRLEHEIAASGFFA
ncbi:hypothetical protein U1872_21710, partial [Sphingomonas sp. RB3P16]|uniref:hypothetical protein n=1 Tax=Parasphingomonas frigoris TaxID=3096163 RepID=UPI002FC7DDDB